MNKVHILSALLLAVVFTGCKQDNWLDWKAQNELWLIENGKRDGVITTSTGLQYEVVTSGPSTGYDLRPDDAKIVTISYSGHLINGCYFEGSKTSKVTTATYLSGYIEGFIEGLKRMKQFDTYRLYIPYELGYGSTGNSVAEGNSSYIPPYSTLIFEVTLQRVN